jgi:REP element-mobilizing transposase RayT
VNPNNPKSDVETEQRQREQREAQPTPNISGMAPVPATEREQPRISPSLGVGEDVQPGPVTQASSELTYVCLLIPRFSDHYMVGDITEALVEWMKQVCVSYGWRLDAISVRPGYLQWIMIVPLNANPAQFMRLIRQHTSEKIFDEFPRYKQKNLSGQFWAPGNFVVAGNQLQTPEIVNAFILQTRRNQGIV